MHGFPPNLPFEAPRRTTRPAYTVKEMAADLSEPLESPHSLSGAGTPPGAFPAPSTAVVLRRRQASLLAYLVTRDVIRGVLVIDTKVTIEDGVRPFEATLAVVGPLCHQLTPAAVEIALILRQEGLPGTVENLLYTSSHLSA
jgi:hypothetical protein